MVFDGVHINRANFGWLIFLLVYDLKTACLQTYLVEWIWPDNPLHSFQGSPFVLDSGHMHILCGLLYGLLRKPVASFC